MQNRYTHKNRRKFSLKVHIVLVTKYRKALLVDDIDDFVKRACYYIAGQHNWNIIAMETDKDHIHILLEYDTTERVCDIISILKQQTTHTIFGLSIPNFSNDTTGKSISFGQTVILPVALAKYLLLLSRNTLSHKVDKKALLPPLKGVGFRAKIFL